MTNAANVVEEVLQRDRLVVIAILSVVIVGCWTYLLTGAGMGMYPHKMTTLFSSKMDARKAMASVARQPTSPAQTRQTTTSLSMGDMMMAPASWGLKYAALMFAMWWLMMVAMMLPSAGPMVLLHAAVSRKSASTDAPSASNPYRSTGAFLSGYAAAWGIFSAVAVLAQWGLEQAGLLSSMMTTTSRLLGAGLLIIAGLWQLTPLKAACLRHCRSPIGFLSTHWRPGISGAFRMGLEHGAFCLGCCWFLMMLLFFGGVMNLIWIVGLAAFVLIEKLVPAGVLFGRISGLLFLVWGVWLGVT